MTYQYVDDQMHCHRKIVKAGNEATGAWLRIGNWCAAHLTDGKVGHEVALLFAKRETVLEKLVTVELLERDGVDFVVHDYLDWNPSADEVEAHRGKVHAARVAAGVVGARKRWDQNGKRYGKRVADGVAKNSPPPPPPPPSTSSEEKKKAQAPSASAQVEQVGRVVARYLTKFPKRSRSANDDGVKNKIRARLRKFSVEEMLQAVDNYAADSWCIEKDKTELEYLVRNDANLEKYLLASTKARGGPSGSAGSRPVAGRGDDFTPPYLRPENDFSRRPTSPTADATRTPVAAKVFP